MTILKPYYDYVFIYGLLCKNNVLKSLLVDLNTLWVDFSLFKRSQLGATANPPKNKAVEGLGTI